jgi:hypothetical protein
MTWLPVCLAFVNPYREKSLDSSQTGDDRKLAHLYGDLHDPGTLALLRPFIENSEASLDGILNIDESFLHGLTLGVTARKSGATDNKTAIFGVFFDDDFQIHTIIMRD